MASLDRMEGDLVEAGAVLLLIVLAIVAWGLWRGAGALPGWLAGLLNRLKALVSPSSGDAWGNGPDIAMTGTSEGNWSAIDPNYDGPLWDVNGVQIR